MYYSSVFVYCVIVMVNLLSLAGANPRWNTILPLDSDKHSTNDNYIMKIGNGINKNNNVILDLQPKVDEDTQYIGSQSDILGNRFGDNPQSGSRRADNSNKISSITNVGKGYQNRNTVVTVNSEDRNVVSQDSDSVGETMNSNTSGTSFVHKNNGLDIVNVGHGSSNKNEIIISDISAHPNNAGSQSSNTKEFENQLKILHNIAEQLEQTVSQLIQEVQMNTELQ